MSEFKPESFNFKAAVDVLDNLLLDNHLELDPRTCRKLKRLSRELIRAEAQKACGWQLTKAKRWELIVQLSQIFQSLSTVVEAVAKWTT